MNREVKAAIRRYAALHPGTTWWDWLPEVLSGLRMLTARSHGHAPFFVVYKQDPIFPGRPLVLDDRFPLSIDSMGSEEGDYVQDLVSMFWELKAEIATKL